MVFAVVVAAVAVVVVVVAFGAIPEIVGTAVAVADGADVAAPAPPAADVVEIENGDTPVEAHVSKWMQFFYCKD
jgi:hypothetical protein